ncbi:Translation elongation factor 1 beta [Hanseniaspora osmophila]
MSFSDFSKVETLKELNTFLADKSYIDGTAATQADVTVYKAFQTAFPEFSRWFNHIASKADEFETLPAGKAPAASASAAAEEEDDDDVDLFGSDDEEVDEAAEKLKAQRLAEYHAKKAAKPAKPAAKSIVTLDVKPWDDETDLEAMVAHVKGIEIDGLVWGAHTWVPIGFGIKKLQINCVVEDSKVSLEELQEQIEEAEDYVQSSDVAAMQKL